MLFGSRHQSRQRPCPHKRLWNWSRRDGDNGQGAEAPGGRAEAAAGAKDAAGSVRPPRDSRFGSPLKLSEVHWVKPELVVEVTYLTWTEDNLLRQVSYQGQREGKPASRAFYSATPRDRSDISIVSAAPAVLKDRPALKGLSPTAPVARNLDLGWCLAGSCIGLFLAGKAAPSERHDNSVSSIPDHTRQL